MSDYLIHDSTLEDIADAIRAKTGGSSLIAPEDMATEIASISGGGGSAIVSGEITFESSQAGATITHNANVSDYIFLMAVKSSGWDSLVADTSNTKNYMVLMFDYCSNKFDYINQRINNHMRSVAYTPSTGAFAVGGQNIASTSGLGSHTDNSVTIAANFGFHPTTYKWWVIPINSIIP